jgi:hypothetical protein
MLKRLMLVIVLCISYNVYASGDSERSNALKQFFNNGLEAYRNNEYEKSLEYFRKGAIEASDDFIIASFYYNAGNSAYKLAERATNTEEKIAFLNEAIADYHRSLVFYPELNSANHNGELALKLLEYNKQQQQEQKAKNKSANSSENSKDSLSDIIEEQRRLSKDTFDSEKTNNELSEMQESLMKKTEDYNNSMDKKTSDLQKAIEEQKRNAKLLEQNERQESIDSQQRIIELLQQAMNKEEKNSDAYDEYIRNLETENPINNQLRQSGGIIEVERNW